MSKTALRILAMAAVIIVTLFVAATLALPGRSAPVAAAAAQPGHPHQSSDIALAAEQPIALPSPSVEMREAVAEVDARLAVSECSETTGLSEAEKNHIAEAASPMAAVTAIDEALGKLNSTSSSKVEGRSSK